MYLKISELKNQGIHVTVEEDVIILEAENPWPHKAVEAIQILRVALGLTDRESDEVTDYVANMTILRAIKNCARY